MKCSKCGKEFGEGGNCQYCGVDRVTGLANFIGYNNSTGSSRYQGYESNNGESTFPKTTVCYACGEIIPVDSEFCPFCSKELYVSCPKCGNKYSSQFPACNKCGTNREKYFRQLEDEKKNELKKEREKERKQREWEQSSEYREQKIKEEASDLKSHLDFKFGAMSVIPNILIMGGGLIGMLKFTPELSVPNSTKAIITIVTTLVLGLIVHLLTVLFKNLGINNWKSKHPNDPRSKYL